MKLPEYEGLESFYVRLAKRLVAGDGRLDRGHDADSRLPLPLFLVHLQCIMHLIVQSMKSIPSQVPLDE